MGARQDIKMKLIFFALLIASATHALPSNDDIESDFFQAKETVQQLLESGNDKNACLSLAKATADEVTASVKTQQNVLDGMSKGDDCHTEGQDLINKAKDGVTAADLAQAKAKSASDAAAKTKINFGDWEFDQLSEGKCNAFFNQPVWKKAKIAVAAAKKRYSDAQSATKTAKAKLETAKNTAKKMATECRCNAKKALEKAVKLANDGAKSANSQAWTKAAHMTCVLAGTKPSDCKVPDHPVVKMVKLSKIVSESCAIKGEWVSKEKSGGAYGGKSFALYRLAPQSIGNNDATTYSNACKAVGLLPIGCGTPSYDCGKKFGNGKGNSCIGMPSSWSCNMMAGMCKKAGWGTNCMAFCTDGATNGCTYTMYTATSAYPAGNSQFFPVCGKYT